MFPFSFRIYPPCHFLFSLISIQVKWYHGKKEVTPSPKVEIVSQPDGTQKLVLKEATTSDAGDYRCEATNPIGAAKSEAPLAIKGKYIRQQFKIPAAGDSSHAAGIFSVIAGQWT